MTVSETYDFLNAIRRTEAEMVKLRLKHDALQSCLLPQAIRYDGDHVQTSPEDRMSEAAAEVVELEKQLRILNHKKLQQISDVSFAIAKLDSDVEQMVLLGFYVGHLPVVKVAEIVHYTERGVYKVKARAVRHLAEKCTQSSC